MTLAEKLLAIHSALSEAKIGHAFGGAIALAYWTREPRGTRDIDVNVFVPAPECGEALRALPRGISWDDSSRELIERDGQARLWWDETPVDLFFSYEPLHDQAESNRVLVPFEGVEVPVLGPLELAALKAVFDRTRDWADIEEMLAAGTLDTELLEGELERLLGKEDPRVSRLRAAAAAVKVDPDL